MGKFKDFDAFYKEKTEELLVFTMFKTKYTMPASMPAKLMIEILRGQKEDNLDPAIVLSILESLLGQKQLEDLTKKGLTMDQMEDLIQWASEEYGNNKLTEEQKEVFIKKK
jgi:hypothetical protein